VEAAGGCIRGVVSQPQETADEATTRWNIPFSSIGDVQCSIARELRNHRIVDIKLEEKFAELLHNMEDTGADVGGRQIAVIQPAIVAVDKNFNILYRWASVPSLNNIGGAIGRPHAKYVFQAVQQSLRGDFSLKEGKDGPGVPSIIASIIPLIFLANGNWIKPAGFGLDKKGNRDMTLSFSGRSFPMAFLKLFTTVGALGATLTYRPGMRFPIALGLFGYIVLMTHLYGDMMDQLWKVRTLPKSGQTSFEHATDLRAMI